MQAGMRHDVAHDYQEIILTNDSCHFDALRNGLRRKELLITS
jgi:hypothetical protein